jgi:hypothetical protein
VASDAKGLRATSSVVNVSVVTPVSIALSSPHRATASQFRFTYTANTGLTYVVQRSPSLLNNFTGLTTNLATSASISFTDNAATGPNNFYRVGRLPNP